MTWLRNILIKGLKLRSGSPLPDNPTLHDIQDEAFRVAQMYKELMNDPVDRERYTPEQRRKISAAIEKLETSVFARREPPADR